MDRWTEGWIAGPSTPVFLVLTKIDQLEDAVLSLARIGVDNAAGVLAGGVDKRRDEGGQSQARRLDPRPRQRPVYRDLGMLAGAGAFVALYPRLVPIIDAGGDLGKRTVSSLTRRPAAP
jgi:hypothetical protein